MDTIEKIILRNLIFNDEYSKRVLPYLKDHYFIEKSEREIFKGIFEFTNQYSSLPTVEALKISLSHIHKDPHDQEVMWGFLDQCQKEENNLEPQWLLDETEKFCQEQAIKHAMIESLEILNDKKGKREKGIIPELLSDALAVSFDNDIGHDYLENAEERYEYYHRKEAKLEFDLDWFNTITNGGIPAKTLNIIMAGVNVGKTLTLCHLAAWYLSLGYNVFYATMEIAEEEIAKRIDANLFDLKLDDIVTLPKSLYLNRINKIKEKTFGKLIVKEYPTGAATVLQFSSTLRELRLKKGFVPQVILVDYLGICASCRLSNAAGMYEKGKSVSEELRGLAQETKTRLWTAVQYNREGSKTSSPALADMAESFAIAMTGDFAVAFVTNEELEAQNQYLAAQLKNRYGNVTMYRKHLIGVSRDKQKLYNLDTSTEAPIIGMDDLPLMDKIDNDRKSKFEGFKF